MALRTDLRVLVVDDMSVSRQILIQMLEHLGVLRVTAAICGSQALEALVLSPTDLVIADLNMPDMDGIDLLAAMRRSRRTQAVRFILASGDDRSARIAQGRALGIDALLIKPFRINLLLNCIELVAGRI